MTLVLDLCLYAKASLARRERCVLAHAPTADGLPRRRCPCAPCRTDRIKAAKRRRYAYKLIVKGVEDE